jgi:hypothetical protein
MRHYYRNPRMSAEEIADIAEEGGFPNFAAMIREGGENVDSFVEEINDTLEAEEEEEDISTSKAWNMLADLTDSVGERKGWPKELIASIRRRFKDEAAKA